VACDGVDAVEKFRKNSGKIILTIMDMVMPRMDGRQTFHAIRKISPEAKIVIASGFSAKEAVTELEREGLAGFVHKPYRMAELSSVVAGVLGKRHRQSTTRPPTSPQNNQRNLFNQDLS
jgi:YesN/AraC family two-component response regulator